MTKTAPTAIALAALIALAAPAANAIEPMSGAELIAHCQEFEEHPTSLDGVACAAYVQGFFGGANATDAEVARTIGGQYRGAEGMLDRAIQTRVRQRVARFGPTAYAGFCIDQMTSTTDLVRELITWVAEHPEDTGKTADALMYTALKANHPCE